MDRYDKYWDKTLGIRTTGRDDSRSNHICYPYEPTDYKVLERLATYGYIKKRDCLLDYGCGKGRVSFFMAYQTGCHTIGIEYDERLLERAERNKAKALAGGRTRFLEMNAAQFEVPLEANRAFFFNPFAVSVLGGVLEQILISYEVTPRDIRLFFYYPSPEYDAFLKAHPRLELVEEIPCYDLFEEGNARERIDIYRVRES